MMPLLPLASALLATTPSPQAPPAEALQARAQRADRVALVRVLDSSVRVPDGDVMKMTTLTRLQVERDLKGGGPGHLELVQLGGAYGPWERRVPGDATFHPSERAVVFLRCPDAARPDRCVLLGLGKGKLPVVPGREPVTVTLESAGGLVRAPLDALVASLAPPGGTAAGSPQSASPPKMTIEAGSGRVHPGSGKQPEKSR